MNTQKCQAPSFEEAIKLIKMVGKGELCPTCQSVITNRLDQAFLLSNGECADCFSERQVRREDRYE